jgi:hypothetical protein
MTSRSAGMTPMDAPRDGTPRARPSGGDDAPSALRMAARRRRGVRASRPSLLLALLAALGAGCGRGGSPLRVVCTEDGAGSGEGVDVLSGVRRRPRGTAPDDGTSACGEPGTATRRARGRRRILRWTAHGDGLPQVPALRGRGRPALASPAAGVRERRTGSGRAAAMNRDITIRRRRAGDAGAIGDLVTAACLLKPYAA